MAYFQQIGSKLFLGAVCSLVENHDFATVLFHQESYDFAAESGESIPMGNHNSEFITAQKSFQYPLASFALEVDAAAEVFDDVRRREAFPHEFDLRRQVVRLRFPADAAVAKGSDV